MKSSIKKLLIAFTRTKRQQRLVNFVLLFLSVCVGDNDNVTTAMYIVMRVKLRVMKDKETKTRFMELRARGIPLAKIAAELKVSKNTLVSWGQDMKEEIDNLEAIELEAMYDKYRLSTRKQVEFFGEILSRIQCELETRNLSEVSTEKLFAMYAHFHREAQRALPELTFRNDDEITVARAKRLPSSSSTILAEIKGLDLR